MRRLRWVLPIVLLAVLGGGVVANAQVEDPNAPTFVITTSCTDDGQIRVDYTIQARYEIRVYEVAGPLGISDIFGPFPEGVVIPGGGTYSDFLLLPAVVPGTTGQLTVYYSPNPPDGSTFYTATSQTFTLPACGAATTTSTTTSTTTTTTAPTTTTTTTPPPTTVPPTCDCTGQQVTVTAKQATRLIELADRFRSRLTCFNVRMVTGGFLVSASPALPS